MVATWEIKTTALFKGKKEVCVFQLLGKRACIWGSVAMGGRGFLWCLAKLEFLESPKVISLIGSSFSFIFMVSIQSQRQFLRQDTAGKMK